MLSVNVKCECPGRIPERGQSKDEECLSSGEKGAGGKGANRLVNGKKKKIF